MTKKKLNLLGPFLLLSTLFTIGCGIFETNQSTKSGSGSGSSSTVTSQEATPHGQITVNLMEKVPFNGKALDSTFWNNMEAYCKAGPTHLIIGDLELVPNQMSRAGFVGSWAAQLYALATTYAGMFSGPPDDADAAHFWSIQDEIYDWWDRYVQAIIRVMERAPQTTATIITNDGRDRVGFRLGPATYRRMGSVAGRVNIGTTVDESQYKNRSR
ncbi:MAG: hypothetical protein V2B13_05455 [Pseudomonadota bacterium]